MFPRFYLPSVCEPQKSAYAAKLWDACEDPVPRGEAAPELSALLRGENVHVGGFSANEWSSCLDND